MTPKRRLWSQVNKNGPVVSYVGTPCWLWVGTKNTHGYGQMGLNGKIIGAHRAAVLLSGTEIPKGLWVLHRCDTPACVRPSHLFLGTRQDNTDDKVSKGRQAAGQAHGARVKASRQVSASGDANGSRLHPERLVRGETHHKAKLTENDVREIRRLRSTGEWTLDRLSKRFGVSIHNVYAIAKRKIWAHVKDEEYL